MAIMTRERASMTTSINIQIGTIVKSKEDAVVFEVTAINRGWYTLSTKDGVEAKERLSGIEADYEVMPEGYDADEDGEAVSAKTKMARQLRVYRTQYVVTLSPSGNKSLSNGDDIALALEGVDLGSLVTTASRIFGLDLEQKYARLNAGAVRMNIGNRLRTAYRNEDHKNHAEVYGWVQAQLAKAGGGSQ